MAIAEVIDWAITLGGNTAHHPTGPRGRDAMTISNSFRDMQAAIARWIGGAQVGNHTTVTTTSYTADDESIILVDDDTAGATVTITLTAASAGNRIYTIKKLGSTAGVTIATPGSETIDGYTSINLTIPKESVTLYMDGSNWHII